LGLCSKDNDVARRGYEFEKKRETVRFLESARPTSSPPDRQERLCRGVPERSNVFVLRVRPLFARKLRYAPSKWRFYTYSVAAAYV
jgi:hypothetical protein